MRSPTNAQLRLALDRYSTALSLRAAKSKQSAQLVTLDNWYRTTLPALLHARSEPYLTTQELGELMRWKLAVSSIVSPPFPSKSAFTSILPQFSLNPRAIDSKLTTCEQRGKWRPRLLDFALSNANDLVQSTTRLAATQPTAKAITILSTLHGIGPATASAIVSLFHPLTEPFFSDEAVEAVGMGKATYTVKALNQYRELMQERQKEGKWDSMEELERACWSWIILRNLEKGENGAESIKGKAQKASKTSSAAAEGAGGSGIVKGSSSTKTRVAKKTPYNRVEKSSE